MSDTVPNGQDIVEGGNWTGYHAQDCTCWACEEFRYISDEEETYYPSDLSLDSCYHLSD